MCTFTYKASAQCEFLGPAFIQDLDTTALSIIITGAEVDDLSQPGQGVCAINISMKHQFIGDVLVQLVSPAGQRVTLMGPSVLQSSPTDLVEWNVQFNANTFGAFPDPGFDEVWDNLNLWLNFTNYVGTYFPHEGSLEDFNTGPVNGEWKLEFIDNSLFGTGELSSYELFFCSTAGIECSLCEPGAHTVAIAADTYCQFDEVINDDVSFTYTDMPNELSLYSYAYAVYNNQSALTDIFAQSQLNNISGGNYTICGLSYQLVDSVAMYNLPAGIAQADIENTAELENICLTQSTNCVEVTITQAPPLVTVFDTICSGESIVVGGSPFFETGTYQITTSANGCDSVSRLELTVRTNPYPLTTQISELSCANPGLGITAEGLPDSIDVVWSTTDGLIITETSHQTVFVGKPGVYTASIVTDECNFTDSIVIGASADYEYAFIFPDTINCLQDTAFLNIDTDGNVENLQWSSTQPFIQIGSNIKTGVSGSYQASFTIGDCDIIRIVNVVTDLTPPQYATFTDTIGCNSDTANLSILHNPNINYNYTWLRGNTTISTDSFVVVTQGGDYKVILQGDNGCADTTSVIVPDFDITYDIDIVTPILTCDEPFGLVTFTGNTANQDVTATWTNPLNEVIIGDTVFVDEGGDFGLNLTNGGGCELDTTFTVIQESAPSPISIAPDNFSCSQDSIQLQLSGTRLGDSIVWKGTNFSSMVEDPWIFEQGFYGVTVYSDNGCIADAFVEVSADNMVPNISFSFGQLDCINDEVTITPNQTAGLDFTWRYPDNSVVNTSSITVSDEGVYFVKYTDLTNDCFGQRSIEIIENKVDSLENFFTDTLNCNNNQVTFTASNLNDIVSAQWYGPDDMLIIDSPVPPAVSQAGVYKVDLELSNGCVGRDSIEVFIFESTPQLSIEGDSITCESPAVKLVADVNIENYSLRWKDEQNNLFTGDSIIVSIPGIYEVVLTAEGQCMDTVYVEVVDDSDGPELTFLPDNSINCINDTVTINLISDVPLTDVNWFGAGEYIDSTLTSATVLDAGEYAVIAFGDNGCSTFETFEVADEVVPVEYELTFGRITCSTPLAPIEFMPADQGYTIEWEIPTAIGFDPEIFEEGNYVFTITNLEGCTITDSITIETDENLPDPLVEIPNQIDCVNDEAILAVTDFDPLASYTWNGPGISNVQDSFIMTPLPGQYELLTTYPNGCADIKRFIIEVDTQIPEIEVFGDSITCAVGKIIMTVESDIELTGYEWEGPDMFESDSETPLVFQQGTYNVTVTGVNNCTTTGSVEIIDVQEFPELSINDVSIPCDDREYIIKPQIVSDNVELQWFGPNDFFEEGPEQSELETGIYVLVAIDENSCTSTDTFEVINEMVPPEFDIIADSVFCTVDSDLSVVGNGFTLESALWSGPDNLMLSGLSVSTSVPGTYTVVVSDDLGCENTGVVDVLDGQSFETFSIAKEGIFECKIETVTLTSLNIDNPSEFVYSWSSVDGNIVSGNANEEVTVFGEGLYVLDITNTSTGCVSSDSLNLLKDQPDFQNIDYVITEPSCEGFANASIDITDIVGGTGPYEVIVDGNSYGPSTEILYLAAGDHSLTVIDSLGCEVNRAVTIDEGDYPLVTLPNDTTILLGDSFFIDAVITPDSLTDLSVVWSSTPPCEPCTSFFIKPDGTYYIEVTVSDANGCSSSDDITVRVDEREIEKFPNIFSPNSDGNNDYFYMPFTKSIENINSLKIYDWFGTLVFETENIAPGVETAGWNGLHNGKPALTGVYMFQAVMTLSSNEQVEVVSDVTLVR